MELMGTHSGDNVKPGPSGFSSELDMMLLALTIYADSITVQP